MAKVKVSFNKYHRKWEVYYHRNGKQHVGYFRSWQIPAVIESVQKVVDVT